MTTITITATEDIHPVCLMYGLKRAYCRFPALVHNTIATSPPFRRSPERPLLFIGCRLNSACVQYYKNGIRIIYDSKRATADTMEAFAQAVVEEYLRLRHPYLDVMWAQKRAVESGSGRLIAEII